VVAWPAAAVALHRVVLLGETTMLVRHVGAISEVLVEIADMASNLL